MRLGLRASGLLRSQSGGVIISAGTSSRPITAGAFLGPLIRAMLTPRRLTTPLEDAISAAVRLPMRLLHTPVDKYGDSIR